MAEQQQYQQKDNSGSVFKNDRRDKETQPHARGKAMVAGVWYWVSAWTKEARDGSKFQSLAFEPMNDEWAAKNGGNKPGESRAGWNPPPARQQQQPQRQAATVPPAQDRGPF